jgi:hypothetical protein
MPYGVIQAYNDPVFQSRNGTVYCVGGRSITRRGDRTPNYKSVAKRLLPINKYQDSDIVQKTQVFSLLTINLATGVTSIGYAGFSSQSQVWNQFYSDSGPALQGVPSDSALQNETKIAALLKLADAKVNLPVAVAEARKTADLVLENANRLFRAYRAFRRRRYREAADVLGITSSKGLSGNWLQYKYGWMPILMDTKNAAEFLAQKHLGSPTYITASVRREYKYSYRSTTKNGGGWFGSGKCTYVRNYDVTKECRVKIQTRVDSPSAHQAHQLGLTNPALVAWELVPYSFVFDWFVGVGDYLQACTALQGLIIDRAMISTMTSVEGSTSWNDNSWTSGGTQFVPSSGSMSTKDRNYFRDPLSVSPSDLYPVRNRDPFSFGKLVTSLSLIRQRV